MPRKSRPVPAGPQWRTAPGLGSGATGLRDRPETPEPDARTDDREAAVRAAPVLEQVPAAPVTVTDDEPELARPQRRLDGELPRFRPGDTVHHGAGTRNGASAPHGGAGPEVAPSSRDAASHTGEPHTGTPPQNGASARNGTTPRHDTSPRNGSAPRHDTSRHDTAPHRGTAAYQGTDDSRALVRRPSARESFARSVRSLEPISDQEAAAFAGRFAADFQSFDEDDPSHRATVLRPLLADPQASTWGWSGRGRQRAESPLPGRLFRSSDTVVFVEVLVRATTYARSLSTAEPELPTGGYDEPVGIVGPSSVPPESDPRWVAVEANWLRMTVPITRSADDGRLVVDPLLVPEQTG
ncbi:hypothetical protein [Pseudonocardia sp. ICBG1293]|uniref:hypothetical protein n=1 Tax=Pseudonocardia sp. ICBG1293 TaxID=2844382 RepID=UPI001CCE94EE|nr:hypothetical protein [Pseudonocardia sp. ICBG1293]